MNKKIVFTKNTHLESCTGGGNIFRAGDEVEIIDGMVKGEYIIKEPLSDYSVDSEKQLDPKNSKIFWLTDSEIGKPYNVTTWYRCMKGQEFVELVQKKHKIVGITFEDNNIGFILDEKEK